MIISNSISIGRPVIQSSAPSLLLDIFGTNVLGAYSLRKLSSSYTGAAIRVRRDTDNAEQDIGFDSNGDLDTSALNAFVPDNGYVVKWYDQSGNGRDGTQISANKQLQKILYLQHKVAIVNMLIFQDFQQHHSHILYLRYMHTTQQQVQAHHSLLLQEQALIVLKIMSKDL